MNIDLKSYSNSVYLLNTNDPRHKLFSINIKRLQTLIKNGLLKIFEKQRCISEERVNKLVAWQIAYYKQHGHVKIRGNIVICKISESLLNPTDQNPMDQTLYIIDGQHRFEALTRIVNNGLIDDINVLVEWIEVPSYDDIKKEFQEINSGVPVPLHYLQPNEIVNRCVDLLSAHYAKAFAPPSTLTSSIKRPQMSVDAFKDILINNFDELSKKHDLSTAEQLTDIIKKLNSQYQQKGAEKMCNIIAKQNKAHRNIVFNGFSKCYFSSNSKQPPKYMFIGLFKNMSDWLNDLL